MVSRVIYLSYVRLTDKIASDWYVEYLIKRGMSVEYWDITELLRENFDEQHSLTTDYLRRMESFDELERHLSLVENRKAVYVLMVTFEARFLSIFRLMAKYRCKLVGFSWGAMPLVKLPVRQRWYHWAKSPQLLAEKVTARVKLLSARALGQVKSPDVVFAAGRVLSQGHGKATRVVPVNLFDFDHHVRFANADPLVANTRYAVFLDTNLPFQSDLAIAGLAALNSEAYYRSLNNFFSVIESRFGIDVVIAAHPKSNYSPTLFCKRLVVRNSTAQLVRDAEFVLTQTSTALSYAVLNSKPVIFVFTSEMERIYKNSLICELHAFSKYVGGALVNIDDRQACASVQIPRVDPAAYERYKYDFLTSPLSESRTTPEIFYEALEAM